MTDISTPRTTPTSSVFDLSEVPQQPRPRWFVQREGAVDKTRGFSSKEDANTWITDLGRRLDWRAGYVFRLRGDTTEMIIVDRNGKKAMP